MRRILILVGIVLLAYGMWFGVNEVRQTRMRDAEQAARETRLREQEPLMRQKLEELKRRVSFSVLEPKAPPDFYLVEFTPMGAFVEKNIITFDYQRADGIVLSVYERPLAEGEVAPWPSEAEWRVIREVQLKNGSPAYFMEKEASVDMPPSSPKISLSIKTRRLQFIAHGLLIHFTNSNMGGGLPDRVLASDELVVAANSLFP